MEENNSSQAEEIVSGNTGYKTEVIANKIGRINSYEVSETELTILEDGDNGGLIFSIAVSFISFSISFLISLFTCDFKSEIVKGIFIGASILLFLFGLICIIIYSKRNKRTKELYDKIKNRNTK